MRYFPLFFVTFLITGATEAVASSPGFTASTPVLCAGTPIDVGTYSDPLVIDWDQDGLKDLVVGQFSEGTADQSKVRIYLNVGTNQSPVFSSFQYMQADGSDLVLPCG